MATQLTKLAANFATQITSNISVGGLTATIASNMTKDAIALPNGKWGFTVNQGKSNEQHFICDLSGVNITNVQSVDRLGTLTTGFAKEARINNEIKITDHVNLIRIVEILNGEKTLDGGMPIKYDTAPALTSPRQIPDKGYIDTSLAGKADLAGNNSFTGNNTFGNTTFNVSPSVPTPTSGSDAANMSYVLGIAFGTTALFPGLNSFDVRYDDLKRATVVHERLTAKTFFINYRTDNVYIPQSIATVDGYWELIYNDDGLLITGNKI